MEANIQGIHFNFQYWAGFTICEGRNSFYTLQ